MVSLLLCASFLGAHCHFVIMFGQQNCVCDEDSDFHYSHSFATWVEADEDHNIVEKFTISWTGDKGVKLFVGLQKGINRDLPESFQRAANRCLHVTMFGPYRVTCSAYQCAKKQYQRLENSECTNGYPKYTVLDAVARQCNDRGMNCIHALSEIADPLMTTKRRTGNAATRFIAEAYRERGLITGYHPEDHWVWDAVKPEDAVVREEGG